LNHGDINTGAVEHATLGTKVILHVDDQHSGACYVKVKWRPNGLSFSSCERAR
jgi:hypothetical protein